MNFEKKYIAKKLLTLAVISRDDTVRDIEGNLDIVKFNNHEMVRQLKKDFAEMGITREHLLVNGFVSAHMVLTDW